MDHDGPKARMIRSKRQSGIVYALANLNHPEHAPVEETLSLSPLVPVVRSGERPPADLPNPDVITLIANVERDTRPIR